MNLPCALAVKHVLIHIHIFIFIYISAWHSLLIHPFLLVLFATQSVGLPSANASKYLAGALRQGLVSEAQLRSAIARIMLTRFKLGEFDEVEGRPYQHVDESVLDSAEHRAMAREAAAASIVMAHNDCSAGPTAAGAAGTTHRMKQGGGCTLPYTGVGSAGHGQGTVANTPAATGDTIAVIGPFTNCSGKIAGGWSKTNCYLHSYAGIPSNIVSILDGVTTAAAKMGKNTDHRSGGGGGGGGGDTGGIGSGATTTVVYSEGTTDLTTISPHGIADAAKLAKSASLTVLGVGTGSNVEKEGKDRETLGLPAVQQELLEAVHAAVREGGGKLVVVVVSAGPVALDPTLADAILYAGYGGEEAGNGVADVLFGAVSPSARFPVTVYEEDYLSKVGPVSDYSSTSGVGRTYRYLDVAKSKPIWQFGYGLSYSTFAYSNLEVALQKGTPNVVTVHATVTNTGDVDAHEVVQLYVSVPGAGAVAPALPIPIRSLQGFSRTFLKASASAAVRFSLLPSQYATVQANGTSVVTAGEYTVYLGGSQPDDPSAPSNVLRGSFSI